MWYRRDLYNIQNASLLLLSLDAHNHVDFSGTFGDVHKTKTKSPLKKKLKT